MTIKAAKFTPEVLLGAPRRSVGKPNSDGTKILYSLSTYWFKEHKNTTVTRLLDAQSRSSISVTEKSGDVQWIGDEHLVLLSTGDDGATDISIGEASNFEETKYSAGTIDGSPIDVMFKPLGDGSYLIAFGASTTPDGELYNGNKAAKKTTSGRVYDSLFVRHWDHYVSPNLNSIWYGTLCPNESGVYALSSLTNALKGTHLASPIDGSTGSPVDYDISPHGLAFVAKDPAMNPANHTKQNLYLATASGSGSTSTVAFGKPVQITIPGFEGATSNPRFSPDGKSLAGFSMRRNGYEADKNQIFLIPDISSPAQIDFFFETSDSIGSWDRSPNGLIWSSDGGKMYVTAEHHGKNALFAIPWDPLRAGTQPGLVATHGSISDIQSLPDGSLFVSASTLLDDSHYYLLEVNRGELLYKNVSSHSKAGDLYGLHQSQIEEFYYDGAQTKIQAWVVKPSNFEKSKKYPLAYLVHGGPQGAWNDSWSTRWNPAVFAEQGYIVVTPNPTGSTGFGQTLTDAIQNQWGGLPYQDLVNGIAYIEENLPYVDMDRAVALGASYGGYMMNWIQGHELGRKFKALVTHDGVFSMTGQLASEELWFPEHEFGGKYWDAKESWLRWDPSRYTGNWSTPHLIIHSEKDFRLTMSEGLSAFNVLQERGVKSRLLVFPDENHWVLQPENSLLWHTVVFDWINDAVGLPRYGDSGYPAQLLKEANMDSGRQP